MNPGTLLDQSRQSISELWKARDARERTMLAVAALVATFGLAYALLIDPALAGRDKLRLSLPVLRTQVAQMQVLSNETAALSSKPAAAPITMSRENIEAALARNNLKPQSVILSGDYVKVRLAAVSFSGTLNWLADLQRQAQIYVVDADIVALVQPDMIDATLTLHQSGNGPPHAIQ